jgi:hypothetical protein
MNLEKYLMVRNVFLCLIKLFDIGESGKFWENRNAFVMFGY